MQSLSNSHLCIQYGRNGVDQMQHSPHMIYLSYVYQSLMFKILNTLLYLSDTSCLKVF